MKQARFVMLLQEPVLSVTAEKMNLSVCRKSKLKNISKDLNIPKSFTEPEKGLQRFHTIQIKIKIMKDNGGIENEKL